MQVYVPSYVRVPRGSRTLALSCKYYIIASDSKFLRTGQFRGSIPSVIVPKKKYPRNVEEQKYPRKNTLG